MDAARRLAADFFVLESFIQEAKQSHPPCYLSQAQPESHSLLFNCAAMTG
jgi:hypothetical protein